MKKRSTYKQLLKTKTSAKRYFYAAVSLSMVAILGCFMFVYFTGSDDASAANQQQLKGRGQTPKAGKATNLVAFFKNIKLSGKRSDPACKPKSGYKKENKTTSKIAFKGKSAKTPYKYVYNAPSAAPPKTTIHPKTQSSSLAKNIPAPKSEELTASLKTSIPIESKVSSSSANSILKKMSPDERKKAILTMKPSRELPPIRFISNQDEFSVANMDSFMEALELVNQGNIVLIEGHTDDLGSSTYNLNLSMKRVEKIRQIMLQAGADDNLIFVAGHGEAKPLVPNTNDENRQINRRIEFKIY